MGKRNDDKGRLPPFVPLLKETLDCPAWKVMSHGARSLYVAIKRRYNHTSHNNGRIYLSQRDACKETGSSFEQIVRWFRELQHYGFIVMEKPGCLGVEGKGQAPRWRLTELGYMKDPPTRDFLRWKPGGRFKNEKQKPAAENRCAPLRKAGAPPLRNSAAPNGTTAAESRCKSSQPLGGAQRAPDPEGESEGPATGEPLSLYELVRGNGRFH